MEILTQERIKNLAMASLAIMALLFWDDSRKLRNEARAMESAYQAFMAKKSNGRPLYTLIRQDTLSVFPTGEGRAVVCGVVENSGLPLRPTP